jgi:MFS family permease
VGITLMILAKSRAGDPSAFWLLMSGAATLAAGNGMIEVTGNPMVAALYPGREDQASSTGFTPFSRSGSCSAGLTGFALVTWGGKFADWPYQLAVIYLPILAYGVLLLPQQFPRTENAAAWNSGQGDVPLHPHEPAVPPDAADDGAHHLPRAGPMRWVPAVLQAGGLHGILVLVWISGWMVVLRSLAGHFVERLSPPGMLLPRRF